MEVRGQLAGVMSVLPSCARRDWWLVPLFIESSLLLGPSNVDKSTGDEWLPYLISELSATVWPDCLIFLAVEIIEDSSQSKIVTA